MSLQNTNLILQVAPLAVTFNDSPQQLFMELVRRTKIVSPSGTNFIFVGDTEPTSNVGPWLKDGNKWYVFDEDIKRYVPADISDSETRWFWIGANAPVSSSPPLWLRTTRDATQDNPSYGDPISWYFFNGAGWVPYNSVVTSGPTANRPASPIEYQMYFDTQIGCLIWWERAAWRTVDGVPGDIKFVVHDVLTDALRRNPGWAVLGEATQAWRGRVIMQATRDPGLTPETVLTVDPGIAQRSAHETFGETDGIQMNPASPVPYPPSIAMWALVKL